MNSPRENLEEITGALLDPGSDFSELRDATAALHTLCSTIVGLGQDPEDNEADRETHLEQGRALSPRDAARCVLDVSRTTAYLRGIHDAVIEAQSRFCGEKINLLYAGCGPFAPLALPLATRFSPDRLGLTLLDAHEYSIDSVRRLAEHLGVSASVSSAVCCDAMNYTHPDADQLHLVVIETMQKALEHEPQVALTRRLAPQLVPGGILIPERIRLAACLADMSAEFSLHDHDTPEDDLVVVPRRRRVDMGTLLELTVDGLRVGGRSDARTQHTVAVDLFIPEAVEDVPDLMVRTSVEVFGGHRLDDYDSGITYPTLIHHLGTLRLGDRLEFRYEEGSSPGLRIRRASTP
jgi:hypothetical protein